MDFRHYRVAAFGLALGTLGLVAGCSEPGSSGSPASPSAVTGSSTAVVRTPEIFSFELCKDYVGTPGPAATFNIAVDVGANGSIEENLVVSLSNGQCREFPITIFTRFNITEVVPAGYTPSWVRTTFIEPTNTTIVEPPVSSNTASGFAGGDEADLIVFTNTQVQPPPPPPGGGEGCTPGFWKQTQHFGSWTAPYTPTTLFSAVFENAFPGLTLAQVLELQGGGLNALGRHTVAALLNAASPNVDYDLTTTQVINMFNAAFPGSNTTYVMLKNRFETLNEAGCPLS